MSEALIIQYSSAKNVKDDDNCMTIADNRHFSYDNDIELIQFIASEMQKEGLDQNNEDIDSYLNSKLM